MDEETCGSWVKYVVDGIVILKAAILVIYSLWAVPWYLKSKLKAISVILILFASCFIVIGELVYRYSSRPIRSRFLLNTLSHWIVFWCLTIMLGFSRKNGAA